MIDIKANSKGCLIREMTGSETEILADIITASLTMLEEAFRICNTKKKNRKTILKIFKEEFEDEFLK